MATTLNTARDSFELGQAPLAADVTKVLTTRSLKKFGSFNQSEVRIKLN